MAASQYGTAGTVSSLTDDPNSVFSDPTFVATLNQALSDAGLSDQATIVPVDVDPATGVSNTAASPDVVYVVKVGTENIFFGAGSDGKPIVIIGAPGSTITLKNGQLTLAGLNTNAAGSSVSFNVVEAGGNNKLVLNKGPSTALSTTGNDTIKSTGGHDTITGGSGQDSITAGGHSLVIAGSIGDTVHGGLKQSARDTIYGTTGGDTIYVSHGKNLIVGGSGPDYLQAGDGQDTIYGGKGANTIYGGGNTDVEAGKKNTIHLTGLDVLGGGTGPNTVFSSDGTQYIQGRSGALDIHVSKTADDTIFGGSGHTVVHIAQSSTDIKSSATADHVTTITFKGGQTLQVENVSVVFTDKSTKQF